MCNGWMGDDAQGSGSPRAPTPGARGQRAPPGGCRSVPLWYEALMWAVMGVAEREKFLTEDWPRIRENMARLGLKPEDLLDNGESRRHKSNTKKEER